MSTFLTAFRYGSIRGTAALLAIALATAGAGAGPLTDTEMYFDPGSISPDFYQRFSLNDLKTQNFLTFSAGADPIVGAQILPMLKANNYGAGYSYSQADYHYTPNADYFADLTTGTLTTTINKPGLYHVRTQRASGDSQVFALFAEAAFKEKDGTPDRSGGNKDVQPLPDADLFLVEESDEVINKSAEIWKKAGKKVQRVTSRADVVKKISDESKALNRKIHVELDGHGTIGEMSTGAGTQNIADKQIDSSSVEAFCEQIRAYCNYLTFQGCSVGAGTNGEKFLQTIATSIGTAGAWDSAVTVVDESGFAVASTAKFIVKIPAPSSAAGFSLLLMVAARRRRA